MHRFLGSRALATVGVSVLAVVGGALLAWWQWTRYESASGTLQNLGYVLQWPLFGVFPAFMFWRIHRSAQRERELDRELDRQQAIPTQRGTPEPEPAEPTSVDPRLTYVQNRTSNLVAEEDQELLAYNHYLAKLADREQHHAG
ncbi:MAG TPA: transcriptional regulator [Pseudonocardiaceae bacterium]|nr:transcriptional regulator [Pseudonocardiaceae bacterium]